MAKIFKLTFSKIENGKAIFSGNGDDIIFDKKYLPSDVQAGDEIIITLKSAKSDEQNQSQTAKEILNEILKN